jgi:hypothetical protein
MSWEREMDEVTNFNHIARCEEHYQVYVCCGNRCVGDYPFCPEHGGEPWFKCEMEVI